MAVSMNANSMRADFMISDAMLPQRIEEIAEEQAGMFAKLLDDIGGANGDLAVQISETVDKYSDMKAAGEAAIYRDKETGRILPEDPKKLVKMVLKGEVKIENIPEELITPEFIRLLMVMRKTEELDEDDEKSLFDPTDAITAEQNFQRELSNSMLMELYQIIEKHNERESGDKVTMLDGISEPIDETRTLPSPVTAENDRSEGEGVFTQIIDNLVETVSEELEVVEESMLDAPVKSNTVVADESVAEVPVLPDIPDAAKTVGTVEDSVTAEVGKAAEVTAIGKVNETAEAVISTAVIEQAEVDKPVEVNKAPEVHKAADVPETAEVIKPVEIGKPAEVYKAAETVELTVASEPVEVNKPTAEIPEAAEVIKPAEVHKAAEASKIAEDVKPVEIVKPAEVHKAADIPEAAEVIKPVEVVKPAEVIKAAETPETAKAVEFAEVSKAADIPETAEVIRPVEVVKPAEVNEAAEVINPAEKGKNTEVHETAEVYVADANPVKAETVDAGTERVIPQKVTATVNVPEQSAESQVTVEVKAEQAVTVQTAVSRNEQSAETTAQQTVPVEKLTVKTEKTEAKPEIAENAVKTDNGGEQITVKAVTRNENAGQLDKTISEEPKTVTVGHERVKSAAEEFEMLRNAKIKAAGKPVEEKLEVKIENTAQPLNAESPIVFKRADGSEIEVRPSTIINQAAKLIEKAVAENDDKSEYSLVLNPEELGKITVKLTKAADGAVSITIAAENARTQRILEQHSDAMQSNLRSSGVNLESWQTVNERQHETASQDYNGSSKNPYYRHDSDHSEENSDGQSFADIIASM